MKRRIVIFILTVLAINGEAQQLGLRLGLGYGRGTHNDYMVASSADVKISEIGVNSEKSPINLPRRKYSDLFQNTQLDLMIEYSINANHRIGMGKKGGLDFKRMNGYYQDELYTSVSSSTDINKYGLEYTYTTLPFMKQVNFLNRISFSGQVGAWIVDNSLSGGPGQISSVAAYSMMGSDTISSVVSNVIVQNTAGFMLSTALRVNALTNRRSGSAASLGVSRDYGRTILSRQETTYTFNDKQSYITTFQNSFGNQWRWDISYNFILRDFTKKAKYFYTKEKEE